MRRLSFTVGEGKVGRGLTLDRGATLIAYGSYLARLALDYIRILTSIADWLSMLYRQLF